MPPDVHRDPDALRAVAAAVESVLPAVVAAPLDPAVLAAAGPVLTAEHERTVAVLERVGRELGELAGVLRAAAAGLEAADDEVRRSLVRAALEGP